MSDEEFKRNVRYFWEKNGNPSFVGYDKERCKKLMPQFYLAYTNYVMWKMVIDTLLKDELE